MRGRLSFHVHEAELKALHTCSIRSRQGPRRQAAQSNLLLIDCCGVVCYPLAKLESLFTFGYHSSVQINTADLLEDLIHVGQDGTMKMSIFAHREQVSKRALGHLQNSVFDGGKFAVNVRLSVISEPASTTCIEDIHHRMEDR